MAAPGYAHRPGGATSHLSAPVRYTLVAGLLAIGVGDLALINTMLLPRYLSSRSPIPVKEGEGQGEGLRADRTPHPNLLPASGEKESVPPLPAQRGEGRGEGLLIPPIRFTRSTSWLSAQSQKILGDVVAELKQEPGRRAVISGHTDDLGPPEVNRSLSLERARRVGRWLQQHGVDMAQLEMQGFGSARPAVEGRTAEARASNRRVEIVIR